MSISKLKSQKPITMVINSKDFENESKQAKIILFLKKIEEEIGTSLIIKLETDSKSENYFDLDKEWQKFQQEFTKIEYKEEQEIQDFLKTEGIIS